MHTFGVGHPKAALGLSLYVIGCKFFVLLDFPRARTKHLLQTASARFFSGTLHTITALPDHPC